MTIPHFVQRFNDSRRIGAETRTYFSIPAKARMDRPPVGLANRRSRRKEIIPGTRVLYRNCRNIFFCIIDQIDRPMGRESAMSFRGFGPQALPFFKGLAFHQTREWLEANREIYERDIKAPFGDLIEDLSAALAKSGSPLRGSRKASLFRLNRDVRFSRD